MFNTALFLRSWKKKKRKLKRNREDDSGNKKECKCEHRRISSIRLIPHEGERSLNVTIRMSDMAADNVQTVFYKDDQQRFSQRYSLKLKTYSLYNVFIEVRPLMDVTYVVLGGKKNDCF